jgi:hypothetical protein
LKPLRHVETTLNTLTFAGRGSDVHHHGLTTILTANVVKSTRDGSTERPKAHTNKKEKLETEAFATMRSKFSSATHSFWKLAYCDMAACRKE